MRGQNRMPTIPKAANLRRPGGIEEQFDKGPAVGDDEMG